MSDFELDALKSELADLAASMKANHLKFAKALADGKTQEEAYRAQGGKAKDGYAAASEMIKLNPKISQYVDLVKEIAALASLPKQIATAEQKRKMLWEIAQRCVQEIEPEFAGRGDNAQIVGFTFNAKGAVSAIAELNKMDGDLAAIKTENKHSFEEELTDDQLDKRIAQLQQETGISASTWREEKATTAKKTLHAISRYWSIKARAVQAASGIFQIGRTVFYSLFHGR